jgi:hypothetical protein
MIVSAFLIENGKLFSVFISSSSVMLLNEYLDISGSQLKAAIIEKP